MITLIESMPAQPSKPILPSSKSTSQDNSFLNTLNALSHKDSHLQKNNILLLNFLNDKNNKKTDNSKSLADKNGINQQLLSMLDPNSLKFIIKNAKQELSSMIKNSPLATAKDIKQMPKTLKGLLQLAKSLKIDISKITLKSVIDTKTTQTLKTTTIDLKKSPSLKLAKTTQESKAVQNQTKISNAVSAKLQKVLQTSIASMPLFQEIKKNSTTQHLTNSIINSNIQIIKPTVKKTNNSILAVLLNKDAVTSPKNTKIQLQGMITPQNIVISQHISLKKDATKEDIQNNLQQAQQNIQPNNTVHVDTQNQTFAVKIHEAKQMVKYLAQNIKQTIDDYKPPFTKINLKLTPKKLGEVDLTVIQRGKNLHVNIASNSNAINILSQNSNDLKAQLSQNGMNNASLNFSNSGNMSDNQNRQRQEDAKKTYRQLDEQNDEFSNSLEIIIPRYI